MAVDQIMLPTAEPSQPLSVLIVRYGPAFCSFTHQYQFFIPHSAMGNSLSQVVNTWFSLYPKVEASCSLAMSVMGSNNLWANLEFLTLMQALEGLHRALYDGVYMDQSAYEDIRETLVKAIPTTISKSHRAALSSKIRYGNEFSLRKRLQILTERLPPSLRVSILGSEGHAPQTWIDTRNFYTHWDDALRAGILDFPAMPYASVRLKQMLRALYLLLAGVSEDTLVGAFSNKSDVSRLLAHLNVLERGNKQ